MDAIMKELITLEKRRIVTGRKNWKRLSEIQTKLLNNAIADTQQAIKNTGALIEKYSQLAKRTKDLEIENGVLFWALQAQSNEREYQA